MGRYGLAATVSIAVHVGVLSQFDVPNAFAMPTGNQTSSIAVQFVKVPSQAISPSPKRDEVQHKVEHTSQSAKEASQTTYVSKTTKAVKANPEIVKPKQTAKLQDTQSKNSKAKSTVAKTKPPVEKPKAAPQKENTQVKHDSNHTIEPQKTASTPAPSKSGVSEAPVLIEQPTFLAPPTKPRYPRLAQRRGIEGTAMYEIWLDENGNQIKQNLLSSSGASMLDEAALDAIKQWKFSPRNVNGVSMAHRVQIPIRFKLD
ncbi:energy transducer TonB [Vibrio gangliei]|uniref:energy transducer TonB n=1 Tax=Vibrio gangliei TaxID=2077090 RepID=UPI001FE7BF32|nr:energy transducer TonB [Vibrio gangliei]